MKIRRALRFRFAAMILTAAVPPVAAGEGTAFDAVNEHYEAIRIALLHDKTDEVADHARAIESTIKHLEHEFSPDHAGVSNEGAAACQALLPEISKAAARVADATDISQTREAFGELSKPMVRYREMVSGERPVVVYCSMAKKAWLQPEGEIGNPYYGQSMAKCGDIVSK